VARILLVDDTPANVKLVIDRLTAEGGYEVDSAASGEEALAAIARNPPDLVLLDVVMPGMNGYEVCREIRRRPDGEALPIILMTALDAVEERVMGLEAGADDFLSRPVSWPELRARVRSLLRIKTLLDTVRTQSEQLEELNRTLEDRVETQVGQIERLNRLRRFLTPAVAELVLSSGDGMLESHRREIAAVCCDLRNFTAFSENAEPEETIALLRSYQRMIGTEIARYDGTIDHFAGDGIMAFLNDPVPCDRPAHRAVQLAVSIRECVQALLADWKGRGHALGFGIGVSSGFATIGMVGFEGRYDYAATGHAVNFAARLCDRAADGQILISPSVYAEVRNDVEAESLGELDYKGIARPTATYSVVSLA